MDRLNQAPHPEGEGPIVDELERRLSTFDESFTFAQRRDGGGIGVDMIVDVASGRFQGFGSETISPGQSRVRVLLQLRSQDTWLDTSNFLSSIVRCEVNLDQSDPPVSSIARDRINSAVARIRERVREN